MKFTHLVYVVRALSSINLQIGLFNPLEKTFDVKKYLNQIYESMKVPVVSPVNVNVNSGSTPTSSQPNLRRLALLWKKSSYLPMIVDFLQRSGTQSQPFESFDVLSEWIFMFDDCISISKCRDY